ncbi:substrate-binding domain-containing protein [Vagococcus sp.]|uniref:substrate-binding domain-containing protein n=1 Tax=Vagococcus sp. TaxID=1933889 RepID=UPI003F9609A6
MKKFKKVLVSLLGVAAVGLLLTGCSTEGDKKEEAKNKEPKDLKIGFSISTLNNPAFVYLKDQIEENAKKEGSKIIVADAQNDSAKQSDNMDDFIQQKVDAIIVNPVDSSAIAPSVEAANDANIPVVAVDRSSDGGEILSLIVSDNVKGGEMAAKYLIDTLGENAKVAMIEGIPGASATNERGEGFKKGAKGKLDIVASQNGDFDRAKSLTVTENILQANPEIKGIFAQNDEEALGALEAVKAAKRDDIVIIGFDGAEDALKSIEEKELNATIGQRFDEMAKLSLDSIYKHYKGEKVDKEIFAPVELITQK